VPYRVDGGGFCFKGLLFFREESREREEKQVVRHGMGMEKGSRGRRENSVAFSNKFLFFLALAALNKGRAIKEKT
jgi:hypothetical protein